MTIIPLRTALRASVDLADIGAAFADAGSAMRSVGIDIMQLHELPPDSITDGLAEMATRLLICVEMLKQAR